MSTPLIRWGHITCPGSVRRCFNYWSLFSDAPDTDMEDVDYYFIALGNIFLTSYQEISYGTKAYLMHSYKTEIGQAIWDLHRQIPYLPVHSFTMRNVELFFSWKIFLSRHYIKFWWVGMTFYKKTKVRPKMIITCLLIPDQYQ